jgi:hypothetical protein
VGAAAWGMVIHNSQRSTTSAGGNILATALARSIIAHCVAEAACRARGTDHVEIQQLHTRSPASMWRRPGIAPALHLASTIVAGVDESSMRNDYPAYCSHCWCLCQGTTVPLSTCCRGPHTRAMGSPTGGVGPPAIRPAHERVVAGASLSAIVAACQLPVERVKGTMQLRLHRALASSDDPGNVLVPKFFTITQENHLPLRQWQRRDRIDHGTAALTPQRHFLRAKRSVRDVDEGRVAVGSGASWTAGDHIAGNPKQPSTEWEPAPLITVQRLECTLEGLCDHVLCCHPVAEAAERIGVETVDVALVQLGERQGVRPGALLQYALVRSRSRPSGQRQPVAALTTRSACAAVCLRASHDLSLYRSSPHVHGLEQWQSHGDCRAYTFSAVDAQGAAVTLNHVADIRQPDAGTGNCRRHIAGTIVLFE